MNLPIRDELRRAPRRELRDRILAGHPVDPDAIAGWTYRGTALGMPAIVERLTWKTFQKAFWRDPHSGRLFGWNVRLHQDGLDAASRPKERRGAPFTTWYYEVIAPDGVPAPKGFDRGLIIDYSRAANPALDTIRFVKDPLVAVVPGDADLLLGVSYVALGRLCVETPTYFLLEREAPVARVPEAVLPAGARPMLTAVERRWAELLMDAILGGEPGGSVPPLGDVDTAEFWRLLAQAAPPHLRPGLRAAVWALVWWPLGAGGRPLFALDREARLDAVERMAAGAARPLVDIVKILACFALAEDPRARAALEGR